MFASTYAAFLETQLGMSADTLSTTVDLPMFINGLNLLGYLDDSKNQMISQNNLMVASANFSVPLWLWFWKGTSKLSTAGELAIEGYIRLMDICMHPISPKSLDWAFQNLPNPNANLAASATNNPSFMSQPLDFVEKKALFDALDIVLRQLACLDVDLRFLGSIKTNALASIEKHSPVGVLKDSYIDGLFLIDMLSQIFKFKIKSPNPFDQLKTEKKGSQIPLFHLNFGLQLHIALGISKTLDRLYDAPKISAFASMEYIASQAENFIQFEFPAIKPRSNYFSDVPLKGVHFTSFFSEYFEALRVHFGISTENYRYSLGIEQIALKLMFGGHLASYQQIGSHGKR